MDPIKLEIVTPDYRIGYMGIAKNANTSIQRVVRGRQCQEVEKFQPSTLVFCVIRNPITRFVSFWKDKVFDSFHPSLEEFGFRPGMGLRVTWEIAKQVPEHKLYGNINQHFRSQYHSIDEDVHIWLMFEMLEEDWNRYMIPMGFTQLPHLNAKDLKLTSDTVWDIQWLVENRGFREYYDEDFRLWKQVKHFRFDVSSLR